MKAGKLRKRIDIQEVSTTRDTHGNQVESWSNVATVYAAVEPINGGEKSTQARVTADVTHKITIRFRAVTPRSRVVYAGRTFDVNATLNESERNRELTLLCTEAV